MPQSVRQRNLFAAEDFTVVYDSFRQANFKAYDYETIKQGMVEYVRENHAEVFNDWIQSSEFVAIIELIAYLGHNLAFRADLASRENFLSTAERRESVLRLADFLGYKPGRNLAARGLLKIESVQTSQTVYSVAGENLKNKSVRFFDGATTDSRENFISVMNEVFAASNPFGQPAGNGNVGGVQTEMYPTEIAQGQDVVFSFNAAVNGSNESFEIHSTEIDSNRGITLEGSPSTTAPFNVLYRDDRQGATSKNTGFFVGFKQGTLRYSDYTLDQAQANLAIDIASNNVNNNDVWVQTVDSTGKALKEWTRVGEQFGTNVIFNAVSNANRSLYAIKTRDNDAITVKFGDGVFTEIPRGLVRVWYRNSLNESYTIDPDDVGAVEFSFDYIGKDDKRYRAKFVARLQESVSNSSASEDTESIRQNASRVYATQDRMVSGTDYAVLPLTVGSNVQKIKSINRVYSGHSRFMDLNDPTGNYQNVKIFSDDGFIYSTNEIQRDVYSGSPTLNPQQLFDSFVTKLPRDPDLINFYYQHYDSFTPFSSIFNSLVWNRVSQSQGPGSSGYLTNPNGNVVRVGPTSTVINLDIGSIIEFIEEPYQDGTILDIDITSGGSGYTVPPEVTLAGVGSGATATAVIDPGTGSVIAVNVNTGGSGYTNLTGVVFTGGNGTGAAANANVATAETRWTRITGVNNNGLGIDDSGGNPTGIDPFGQGAISLNKQIPQGAKIKRVFPAYAFEIDEATASEAVASITTQNSFGLRFNSTTKRWRVINADNLAPFTPYSADTFNLTHAGNMAGINIDDSWLIRADYANSSWVFRTRQFKIVFGSEHDVRFYNANNENQFNTNTNKVGKDTITLLAGNTRPDMAGIIKNDMSFHVHAYSSTPDGYTDDTQVAVTVASPSNDLYPENPVAFRELVAYNTVNLIEQKVNGSYQLSYTTKDAGDTVHGRGQLHFKWSRMADSNQRIDPAASSIIDVFVLTQAYNQQYRQWLAGNRRTREPAPPTNQALAVQFDSLVNKKSMSDTVIYRAAKYKPLFGPAAPEDLQAMFKVIRQAGSSISDNEIKSQVVTTIKEFFEVDNWDFGESFYFTELATYIHNQNLGTLASVAIVPRRSSGRFGELFQIQSETNELFIPDVTVATVEIVDRFSSNVLRSR